MGRKSIQNDFFYFLNQNDLDDPERGMIFVCSATHKTKVSRDFEQMQVLCSLNFKKKIILSDFCEFLYCLYNLQSMFFFLAQTEQGDIFKITLETDEDMVCLLVIFKEQVFVQLHSYQAVNFKVFSSQHNL